MNSVLDEVSRIDIQAMSQVRDQVMSHARDQVMDQIWDQFVDRVCFWTWDQLREEIYEPS